MPTKLICPECGLLQAFPASLSQAGIHTLSPSAHWQLRCQRCRRVIHHGHQPNPRERLARSIAFASSAIIFFVVANFFPIAELNLFSKQSQATLIQTIQALFSGQNWFVATLVLCTTVLFPAFELGALLYLCIPLYRQVHHDYSQSATKVLALPGLGERIIGWLVWLHPWSMIEVLLLGIVITIVKLQGFAQVTPGLALWALLLLLLALIAAFYTLNQALRAALEMALERTRPRLLQHHYRRSMRQTWAFLIAATAFYLPANLLPVMETRSVYATSDDTIFSGVVYLWDSGSWILAAVIFLASIVVPLFKLFALGFLLLNVHFSWQRWRLECSYLYRVIEVIGRWSMLDIFVATMLASLVQLQGLGRIYVAGGAAAFAAVVILTMLAAQSFDPRLLWLNPIEKRNLEES